jgi:hypothetical protein
MKSLLWGVLFFIVAHPSLSQKAPAKFGDVPVEDLNMTIYSPDSTASAVILVDFGESELRYNQEKGFVLGFERHLRIKILKPDGLSFADQEIRTYNRSGNSEKISVLKGITFNLENGKVVETKLKNDQVFKTTFDKNWDITKFSMPNVKVGSVIDITYSVTSDFFMNFQDWEFQSTIPVVWSEYRARVPEYFHYDKYMQGYVTLHANESERAPTQITLRWKDDLEDRTAGRSPFHEEKIDLMETKFRWIAKEVPAFKAEPFLTTPKDYISKINFELASTQFPRQPIRNYLGNWNEINKTYFESNDFGGEITSNGYLKKTVEELTAGIVAPKEKVAAIVNYLKKTVAWDGRSTDFSGSQLKKVLDDKKGNSAEINLLLCSMLEKAGLEVYPILSSTRDNGFIREMYPHSSQFNYVLCGVKLDDNLLLLDATDPFLAYNIIPERCLNGKGMAVAKSGPFWVNLAHVNKTKTIATATLNLNENGELAGQVSVERTGYSAANQRKKYQKLGETEYLKEFGTSKDWDITKSSFENLKDYHLSFKEKHEVGIFNNQVTQAGDVIYINPFVLLQKESNPFKLEKREYPVDFGFSNDEIYVATITIPDGFVVEELPKSKVMMLPENASKFMFNVSQAGNKIMITSNLSINKSLFIQDEYPGIREMFNQIVAKHSEQIVLKKKT